jgi:hypothetical protein
LTVQSGYYRPVVESFATSPGSTVNNYSYVVQPLLPVAGLVLNDVFYDITNNMCWQLITIYPTEPTENEPTIIYNRTVKVNNNFFTSVKDTVYQTVVGNTTQTACQSCTSANWQYFYNRS